MRSNSKICSLILLVFSFVLFVSCGKYSLIYSGHEVYEDVYHDEEYPEIYKKTLDAMFGENYEISSGADNSMHIGCCSDAVCYFTEWNVSYMDGNGSKQQFYMANRLPLSHWINNEVERLAEQFYSPLYNKYFSDIPLRQSSDMYFSILHINCGPDEVPKIVKKTDKYIENLSKPKNAVPFYKITEKNLFDFFPMEFDLHVFIDDSAFTNDSGEIFLIRKEAEKAVDEFVSEFNALTENQACWYLLLSDDISGKPDTRKFYIKGSEIKSSTFTFERDIFNALKEKFY